MLESLVSPAFWPTALIGLVVFFIIKKLMQTEIYTNFFIKSQKVIITEKSKPVPVSSPPSPPKEEEDAEPIIDSPSSCECKSSPTSCCKSNKFQH